MKKKTSNSLAASHGQGERDSAKTSSIQYEVIKIAMDVDANNVVFARQIDNATAQPPQKLSQEKFLKFMAQQKQLARRVVSCYEAGPFGYGLHRMLLAMGVENLVIAPQDWDERGQKVKTDNRDAAAISTRLDRYVAGNTRALAVVRVPTVAEELSRSRSRLRQQVLRERQRMSNMGKSLLLYNGLKSGGGWWRDFPKTVKMIRQGLSAEVAESVISALAVLQTHAVNLEKDLDLLTLELRGKSARQASKSNESAGEGKTSGQAKGTTEKANSRKKEPKKKSAGRIVGIGDLSMRILDDEICDWNRFTNRRQVASYTGLCPGVRGSGGKFTGTSLSKCGNPRLRCILVELAWMMIRHQPDYQGLRRWKQVLSGKNRSARKKAAAAIARRLAVDLWRIQTGRTTAAALGLRVTE